MKPHPSAAPLAPEEFAALMPAVPQPIAIAVSGGPDSMALAWCAQRWAKTRADNHNETKGIIAFIVDHQLRPESGDEAKTVRQRLAALGIPAEILRWNHPPVTTRIHATARQARYDLLLNACRRHGIATLLLAHQREDQAETVLMRLAKGSGIDGLAGMAATTTRNGVSLLRPLLAIPKARLIATCEAANIPYVNDPSNSATKYARGRLRQVLPLLAAEGLTIDRLIDLGERAQEAKDALDHATETLLRTAVKPDRGGRILLQTAAFDEAPKAIAIKALSACLAYLHKDDYPPERAALLPLVAALQSGNAMKAHTLYGVIVSRDAAHITLLREPASVTDRQPLAPGGTVVWDGRWRVTLSPHSAAHNLEVRALGPQEHATLDRLAPKLRKQVPQGRARSTLPGLWRGATLIGIPALTDAGNASKENAESWTTPLPPFWSQPLAPRDEKDKE